MIVQAGARQTALRVFSLAAVLAVVALLYAHVSTAWFCGYDDFNEVHRAAIADTRDPARIVNTKHFVDFMYRPITSAMQYATWNLFHSAAAFRLRNLAMHLICVAMLYGILRTLSAGRWAALAAALLFGLEPLANETVVVAVWTNAAAYALLFSALFCSLRSLQAAARGAPFAGLLVISLLLMFAAIFTYEPTIIGFAMMIAYFVLWRLQGLRLPAGYTLAAAAGIALNAAAFFCLRHLVLTGSAQLNSPGTIAHNAALYAVALVLPIDFVLAHALFGTPFPSQIHVGGRATAMLLAIAAAVSIACVWYLARAARLRRTPYLGTQAAAQTFLAVGVVLGVLPMLLFRDHPSEHDLYFSAACFIGLACMAASRLHLSSLAYGACSGALAISFAAGVYQRNARVESCASIARSIVSQLPIDRWRTGLWNIRLADVPGEQLNKPYAIYNDVGLMTLDVKDGAGGGVEHALQTVTGNAEVTAQIVRARALQSGCPVPNTCFWVSRDGRVAAIHAYAMGRKY